MIAGVISDTHGLLRDEVYKLFSGVDIIIHAGDIGSQSVITGLNNIARTVAVLGNTDKDYFLVREYKQTEYILMQGRGLYLIHDVGQLDINLKAAGVEALIHGHTHNPEIVYKNGVLYFNPGSAGPKRPHLPVSVGIIKIYEDKIEPKLIEICAA